MFIRTDSMKEKMKEGKQREKDEIKFQQIIEYISD